MRTWRAAIVSLFALIAFDAARAGESVDYLYRLHCSGCHGIEGLGSKVARIPPFVGIVGHFAGTQDGRLYLVRVPGVANAGLPDAETADLLNYVLRIWGSRDAAAERRDFTAEEVHRLRGLRLDDVTLLRGKLAQELSKNGISIDY